uniref:Uncharacterized protein n=1 Tax=Anguilla anguilla TaxID=7936 RepID=A0A0E9UF31_ANGAN
MKTVCKSNAITYDQRQSELINYADSLLLLPDSMSK